MRKLNIELFLLFFLSVLISSNSAFATSYSIGPQGGGTYPYTIDPPYSIFKYAYGYHWDDWFVDYDSKTQEFRYYLAGGNAFDGGNSIFEITSDTGVVGERVPITLTFKIETIMQPNGGSDAGPSINADNFAGSDYFEISTYNEFGTRSWDSYPPHTIDKLSYGKLYTDPWSYIDEEVIITLNAVYPTYTPFEVFFRENYVHDPFASGFKVVDSTLDCRFIYTIDSKVTLLSAKVPEPTSLSLLFFGSVGILVCWRKRIKNYI